MNDDNAVIVSPKDSGDLDEVKARTLERVRKAAESGDRKAFLETGKEVEWFGYAKDYDKLYAGTDNAQSAWKAKLNRASEFVEVIGSELYPQNPTASVNSREHATYWQKKRHKLEQDYINYANDAGSLEAEARQWTNQAMTYGRGVMWVGYDPRNKVIVHSFDTVDNFGVDPDARSLKEVNFIWRKRRKPRWELSKLYAEKKDKIDKLPKVTERQSDGGSTDPVLDLIEYYEYYFLVGLGHYSSDLMVGEQGESGDVAIDDSPKKYCAVGQTLLSVSDWEIPLWRDGMWPATLFDPRSRPGKLYPNAPMEPGLPHLRAMNHMYTRYLTRINLATRMQLILARYNGQGLDPAQFMKILKGEDLDAIILDVMGDSSMDINKFVQQFKIDAGIDELDHFLAITGREFEKSTGLYEILYAGNTEKQARSATEIDLKKERSHSRIDDMKTVMYAACSDAMRKTIFSARYLHTPADIAALFGPDAGKLWGTLAPPELCAQEEQYRAQSKQMLMQQAMQQAQMMARQAAMMPPMPGPNGMPMAPQPPPPMPTDDELEEQLGPPEFVSMESWINEADRSIEAGSMRRMDHDAQVDNLNVALNQLAPAVVAMPGGAQFVAAIAREFTRINRYSNDMQDAANAFYKEAAKPLPMPIPGPVVN